jgi:hypothetical protein
MSSSENERHPVSQAEVQKILNWDRATGTTARVAFEIGKENPESDDRTNWKKAEELEREQIRDRLEQR